MNLRINETLNQTTAAACPTDGMFASSELNDFAMGGPSSIKFTEESSGLKTGS
jgi:hypothetical protein